MRRMMDSQQQQQQQQQGDGSGALSVGAESTIGEREEGLPLLRGVQRRQADLGELGFHRCTGTGAYPHAGGQPEFLQGPPPPTAREAEVEAEVREALGPGAPPQPPQRAYLDRSRGAEGISS